MEPADLWRPCLRYKMVDQAMTIRRRIADWIVWKLRRPLSLQWTGKGSPAFSHADNWEPPFRPKSVDELHVVPTDRFVLEWPYANKPGKMLKLGGLWVHPGAKVGIDLGHLDIPQPPPAPPNETTTKGARPPCCG